MFKHDIFIAFGNMSLEFRTLVNVCENLKNEHRLMIQAGHSFKLFKNSLDSTAEVVAFLPKNEFLTCIQEAEIIIAHAGVGVLSECLKLNKKPIVIPRRKSLGEHTNDHQSEFLNKYKKDGIFHPLVDQTELRETLRIARSDSQPSRKYITDLGYIIEDLNSFISTLDYK